MTKVKFKGKVAWARVQEGNFDDYRGSKNWKISLYPDKEMNQKIKDSGTQARLKFDEGDKSGVEGKYYQFKRQVERDFGKGKGVEQLTPVVVTLRGEPYDGAIGNGSECEIEVELYDTKQFGKGTRLISVDILDLIEYIKDEGEESEDDEAPFEADKPKVENIVIDSSEPKVRGKRVDW